MACTASGIPEEFSKIQEDEELFLSCLDNVVLAREPTQKMVFENGVRTYWFQQGFAQSSYGKNKEYGCFSCTIISVLNAELIVREKINLEPFTADKLPTPVVKAFALAITHGNVIYKRLKTGDYLNYEFLDVHEALKATTATRKSTAEWVFLNLLVSDYSDTNEFLKMFIDKFESGILDCEELYEEIRKPRYILAVFIALGRTTLLCIDKTNNTANFYDSHGHDPSGALFSQSSRQDIRKMLCWIGRLVVSTTSPPPLFQFEVAFLQVLGQEQEENKEENKDKNKDENKEENKDENKEENKDENKD